MPAASSHSHFFLLPIPIRLFRQLLQWRWRSSIRASWQGSRMLLPIQDVLSIYIFHEIRRWNVPAAASFPEYEKEQVPVPCGRWQFLFHTFHISQGNPILYREE